ncbi:acylphosphatase [Bifidobacterium scardovii]|uniref:acylphosphatase n=1 Tax=Bifidobacterium scardovii TaxID=158787 RepID=UPI0009E2FE71|nr:acylphosphatase [Bifidobacterium scardovii]
MRQTARQTKRQPERGVNADSPDDSPNGGSADDENAEIRVHATVTGLVQGVGFRYFTVMNARRIGVRGWVRNCYDGSVEVEAQGTRAALAQLVSWLKVGPQWARVEHVEVRSMPLESEGTGAGFRVFSER